MIDQKLFELLQRLIEKPLPLEEFYSLYQEDWERNEFFRSVADNIEDTLEHVRGDFISGQIDVQAY